MSPVTDAQANLKSLIYYNGANMQYPRNFTEGYQDHKSEFCTVRILTQNDQLCIALIRTLKDYVKYGLGKGNIDPQYVGSSHENCSHCISMYPLNSSCICLRLVSHG